VQFQRFSLQASWEQVTFAIPPASYTSARLTHCFTTSEHSFTCGLLWSWEGSQIKNSRSSTVSWKFLEDVWYFDDSHIVRIPYYHLAFKTYLDLWWYLISHFWVAKQVLIHNLSYRKTVKMQEKLISIWKVGHQDFFKTEITVNSNSIIAYLFPWKSETQMKRPVNQTHFKYQKIETKKYHYVLLTWYHS